jgi:hypothetical protein
MSHIVGTEQKETRPGATRRSQSRSAEALYDRDRDALAG